MIGESSLMLNTYSMAEYTFKIVDIDVRKSNRTTKIQVEAIIKNKDIIIINQKVHVKVVDGIVLHNNAELIKVPKEIRSDFLSYLKRFVKGHLENV